MEEIQNFSAKFEWKAKIDLLEGFWQIPVCEEDRYKTAFTTPFGLFEWNVLPFGIKSAPALFIRFLQRQMQDFDKNYVKIYMDDIYIVEGTKIQVRERLKALKDYLGKRGILINDKKTQGPCTV